MGRLVLRVTVVLAVVSSTLAPLRMAGVASAGAQDDSGPPAGVATGAATAWTPPLSTRGRYIVDANGLRFKLRSGNWNGASGTWLGEGDPELDANHHAAENSGRMPLGLDRAPISEIVSSFQEIGVNSIRLQFSNEMVHDTRPVSDPAVAANPQLRGLTPLQVYDVVVDALTDAGLAVILNNHTNTTRWCCGIDGNERWNSSQTVEAWENDWLFMVRRYRENPRVVGADLYNEVRRDILDDPNWGLGDKHDWFAASQRVGDRILREVNPDLLIIVEGINWYGIPVDGFAHGRPTLEPVKQLSHTLVVSGKLVYSAHFYDFTGPNHSGATGIGETSDPRHRDLGRAELYDVLYRQALYVAAEADRHFTAPVWISEFGIASTETGEKQRAWFTNFVDFLIQADADFAYWPLVGWQESRARDGYPLLHWDRAGNRFTLYDGGDWRAEAWTRLVSSGRTGHVEPAARWSMLSPDHGDFVQSLRMRAEPDWDNGAIKAACPDGQRLVGLSHTGNRALCTDTGAVGLWASAGAYEVVVDERYVTSGDDWASGYTKLQCPVNSFLIGYSVRGDAVSRALCAVSATALPASGRTVWFDRGDNRPTGAGGGDFAYGHYKGQCGNDEYAAGIAYTGRLFSARTPDALYCRNLPD